MTDFGAVILDHACVFQSVGSSHRRLLPMGMLPGRTPSPRECSARDNVAMSPNLTIVASSRVPIGDNFVLWRFAPKGYYANAASVCETIHFATLPRQNDYKRMRGFEALILDHACVKQFSLISSIDDSCRRCGCWRLEAATAQNE